MHKYIRDIKRGSFRCSTTGGKNKCGIMISPFGRFALLLEEIDSIVVCASSPVISKEKDFEMKKMLLHYGRDTFEGSLKMVYGRRSNTKIVIRRK